MRLLLDTNIVLFILMDDPRLKTATRTLIADEATERHVSVVTLWEVAIKAGTGRLPVPAAAVAAALEPSRMSLLPLDVAHVLALEHLPQDSRHRDPFDRILLAQAQAEGLTLLTSNAHLAGYGVPVIAA